MKSTIKNYIDILAPLCVLLIIMGITLGGIAYAQNHMYDPYAVAVTDKYYSNMPLASGYFVEDLNVPLSHSRLIPYNEWIKMEIGKTYLCTPLPVSIFDMNPHHSRLSCVEIDLLEGKK